MIVRMVHPDHGATHVYDTSELERLKGYGWSVEGEEAKPVKTEPEAPARKKPGPKPKAKQ
jgi:hypothetical protein